MPHKRQFMNAPRSIHARGAIHSGRSPRTDIEKRCGRFAKRGAAERCLLSVAYAPRFLRSALRASVEMTKEGKLRNDKRGEMVDIPALSFRLSELCAVDLPTLSFRLSERCMVDIPTLSFRLSERSERMEKSERIARSTEGSLPLARSRKKPYIKE